jgi:DNA-binding transcriptional MerR regulator
MNPTKDTPLYNLKAVVQETGLKPDTLRAWERRYGVPSPKRAGSGHRLYSQNDIDMLHWLVARQEEGLSISRAVEMWQRLHDTEESALFTPLPEVTVEAVSNALPSAQASDNVIGNLRDAWIAACMRFDEQTADQTLTQAFGLFSPETVCIDLIQKGLAAIGEGWYRGRITVQQEHFASALALRRIEAMLASTPQPTRAGRIMIGCPPEEEHTFVPLTISLLLRRRGWDVLYLGANVPLDSLESTIATIRPNLVILTAQQLHTAASLLEMAELLLREHIPLGFGGLIFNRVPGLHKTIPGHYLGTRVDKAIDAAEQLMLAGRLKLAQHVPTQLYRQAFVQFRDHQARIEADVWQRMEKSNMPPRLLAAANANFSRNILAALSLGDIHYLGPDMDWIEGLLIYHAGLPADKLDIYLETYLEAARASLGDPEHPLVQWLSGLLGVEPQPVRMLARHRR